MSTVLAIDKVEAIKYDIRIFTVVIFTFLFFNYVVFYKEIKSAVLNISVVGSVVCVIGVLEFLQIGDIKNILIQNYWGLGSRPGSITSTFMHNNIYGNYLVLLIFLTLGSIEIIKNKYLKIVFAVLIFLFVFNLILSLSRSAWASFGFGLILLVFKRTNFKRFLYIFAVVIIFGIGIWKYDAAKNRVFIKLSAVNYENINKALSYRLDLWNAALLICKEKPIFGIGVNNYKNYFSKYIHNYEWKSGKDTANNQYLNILAEQGLVGFVSFVTFSVYCIYIAIKNILNGKNDYFSIGLMSYFVSAFFDYMWMEYMYMFLFFFLVGINFIEFRNETNSI